MNLRFRRKRYHQSPKAGLVYLDSSYELRAAILLDVDNSVLNYQTQVGFLNEYGKKRRLDFLVCYENHIKIIETKPKNRLHQYTEQIEDNRKYATLNGYVFELWTEKELGFRSDYFATKWADEFLSNVDNIDYPKIRKQRNLSAVKKFYKDKIATDTIHFFCAFCQETHHNHLRKTYDANIKKNGRFICHKENGFLVGKLPKKKKVNPYAAEGKKQCMGECKQILLLEEFGKDKHEADGHARVCKKCRAKKSLTKYYITKQTTLQCHA